MVCDEVPFLVILVKFPLCEAILEHLDAREDQNRALWVTQGGVRSLEVVFSFHEFHDIFESLSIDKIELLDSTFKPVPVLNGRRISSHEGDRGESCR